MNDIAEVSFKLAQPLFADPYRENRGNPGRNKPNRKMPLSQNTPPCMLTG